MTTYRGYLKHCSEHELVQIFSEDEQLAFSEIVRRFSQHLENFIQRMLSCDSPTAKDIIQMTFCKILLALRKNQYRFEGFKAWIYKIARNEALNYLKANPFFINKDEPLDRYYDNILPDNPEHLLEYKEKQTKVNQIFNSFTDKEKLFIELRAQKVGYDKISEITNASKPHVYYTVKDLYKIVKNEIYK